MSNIETKQEKPIALICQPFGIGDCIFSMGIANSFCKKGYEVVWPVLPQFIDGLQIAYPHIIWVGVPGYERYLSIRSICTVNKYLIVPIRWSAEIAQTTYRNVMRAKYWMYDMDWREWRNCAMPMRNPYREEKLHYEVLGLVDGEKYTLINRFFRSDSSGCAQIKIDSGVKTVEMCSIEGYSLFDWIYTMELASEIHSVSTSALYLFELFDFRADIHLYLRAPDEINFKNVDYIFTKKYILHK